MSLSNPIDKLFYSRNFNVFREKYKNHKLIINEKIDTPIFVEEKIFHFDKIHFTNNDKVIIIFFNTARIDLLQANCDVDIVCFGETNLYIENIKAPKNTITLHHNIILINNITARNLIDNGNYNKIDKFTRYFDKSDIKLENGYYQIQLLKNTINTIMFSLPNFRPIKIINLSNTKNLILTNTHINDTVKDKNDTSSQIIIVNKSRNLYVELDNGKSYDV